MEALATRRQLVTGLAGVSLAGILMDPRQVAKAAAMLETVQTDAAGNRVSAALALPATTPAGAAILIHEWWGLNDHIKAVAGEVAALGYIALAIDLYGGNVATTPEDAKKYMQAVDPAQARATMSAWIDWLRARPDCTGKVASIGWCFGGGMSLQAALDRPLEGAVIYYGNVQRTPDELAALKGPVLGQFASRDQWITPEMVTGFQGAMKSAGQGLEHYSYEADHAFANPTGQNYDAEDARLAWDRTADFLKQVLG
jgi:carboxymethylenebutenolidase